MGLFGSPSMKGPQRGSVCALVPTGDTAVALAPRLQASLTHPVGGTCPREWLCIKYVF